MQMHRGVLFLTLRAFSATGGIEKVCKVLCKVLSELNKTGSIYPEPSILSMYDAQSDVDGKYLHPSFFTGFAEKLSS